MTEEMGENNFLQAASLLSNAIRFNCNPGLKVYLPSPCGVQGGVQGGRWGLFVPDSKAYVAIRLLLRNEY